MESELCTVSFIFSYFLSIIKAWTDTDCVEISGVKTEVRMCPSRREGGIGKERMMIEHPFPCRTDQSPKYMSCNALAPSMVSNPQRYFLDLSFNSRCVSVRGYDPNLSSSVSNASLEMGCGGGTILYVLPLRIHFIQSVRIPIGLESSGHPQIFFLLPCSHLLNVYMPSPNRVEYMTPDASPDMSKYLLKGFFISFIVILSCNDGFEFVRLE